MTAFPLVRFAAAVLLLGSVSLADAPAAKPAVEKDQATLDKEFAAKLTNVKLVGSFTMGEGEPRKDSYTILRGPGRRGRMGDHREDRIQGVGVAAGDEAAGEMGRRYAGDFADEQGHPRFRNVHRAGDVLRRRVRWHVVGRESWRFDVGKIVKIADEPAKTK